MAGCARALVVTFAVLALWGCAPSSAPAPSSSSATSQLREALRASPDHLGARADDVVASGDPAVIARFVRERIGVLAPLQDEQPDVALRFGARGALRAGVGTLRDRAELLAQLVRRAGLEAEVVVATRGAWGEEIYGRREAAFAPDEAGLASAARTAGVALPDAFADDASGARIDDIVAQITAAIPGAMQSATRSTGPLPTTVPIVEITDGDGTRSWAIALGSDDLVTSPPAGLAAASPASGHPVRVSVSVALAPPAGSSLDPQMVREVVAADYGIDDVVGRSLTLTFPPPVAPDQVLGRDVTSFPIRMPVLTLQSLEPLAETVERTHGGYPVSLAGAVYAADADGMLVGPFGEIPPPLDTAARAAARARVATVRTVAHGAASPAIDLDVTALDVAGEVVEGLAAEDFVVTDEGAAVTPTLLANAPPASVRVLVLYDASGSVAESWGSPAARTAFEQALARALAAAAGAHPFQAQVVALGSRPGPTWVSPEAGSLEASLAAITVSSSDVWAAVGDVVPHSGAAAAILVSDCVSSLESPELVPGWQAALAAAGVPIAVVPIGTPDALAVDTISTRSGGAEIHPTAPTVEADLESFVAGAVATRATAAYRLRYVAPETGPAMRTVQVSIGAPSGSATYERPSTGDRVVPSGVAGVYVSITVGGVTDTRRLGGVPLTYRGEPARAATSGDLEAARSVLNGITDIAFEAPGATESQRLDDVAAAIESTAALRAASDDASSIVAAAASARRATWLAAMLAEATDDGASTTPSAIAVRVLTHRPSVAGVESRTDLPPALSTVVGTSRDPARAFADALRASVGASVREEEWLASSAAEALRGRTLVLATTSDGPVGWSDTTRFAFRPLLERYDGMLRLVPENGEVVAMWVVDPATGSATAVWTDQSGGGGANSHCRLEIPGDLLNFIGIAMSLISMFCTVQGPNATSAWACVRAQVYGAVVLALGSFTAPVNLAQGISGILGTLWNLAPTPSPGARLVSFCLQVMLLGLSFVDCTSSELGVET
ncbi:MAG: hypothetical protein U0234_25925 [Sandaracinus sp.]